MRMGKARLFCKLDGVGESLARATMGEMSLSARAYYRVLKLARAIAALAACEQIQTAFLAEPLQYRPRILMA